MRILCFVNHYFGPPAGNAGYQSSRQKADVRREYVLNTISALRRLKDLPQVSEVRVNVCGKGDKTLLPLDFEFSALKDPRLIIYESLSHMASMVDEFDYFINVEDDIIIPPDVLINIFEFDCQNFVNECLHPNRIEVLNGTKVALDPMVEKRVWTFQEKTFKGHLIRVATNPHSGLLILSREKLKYALGEIDPSYRGSFVWDYMDSAFGHYHKPFSLYRPYKDLNFHAVIHQDRHHPLWQPRIHRWLANVRWTIRKIRRFGDLTLIAE